MELLYPHLDYYFLNIPKVHRDQALRPLAKICEKLCTAYYKNNDLQLKSVLKPSHKETMIECCFDWLITNQKVACEVYAMQSLYFLGTEQDWIHPELKTIIESNIHQKSAGYKSKGKYILKLIQKNNC
jgi:hypothetical protein